VRGERIRLLAIPINTQNLMYKRSRLVKSRIVKSVKV